MKRAARAGFSLIEALVVLAIGGMALAIVFGIGIRAGDSGFGLGRRAMEASDADVAFSDLRAILRSVALRPPQSFYAESDRPMLGEVGRLEADVVMERATTCATQGYSGRLILTIEGQGADQRLMCAAGGRSVELARLGGTGVWSYSTDGSTWSTTYSNAPERGVYGDPIHSATTVLVRLAAPRIEVVERLSSGRPELWNRPPDDI